MPSEAQLEILDKFKGQTLRIPDLTDLYASWPSGLNPSYEKLKLFLRDYLAKFTRDEVVMEKFLKADFALFAACWWPNAGFEELKTCACLAIWLFLWDDEIDQADGRLAEDYEKAELHREDTKAFLAYSLGLVDELPEKEYHLLISSFSVIGDFLVKRFTRGKRFGLFDVADGSERRQLLYSELLSFIEAARDEQAVRLRDEIPTVDEYWRTRLGTSAVGVCNVMVELVEEVELPLSTMSLSAFTTLWTEANVIVSITNDILSLRKELAQKSIYSLVPLSAVACSPQEAVDTATIELKASIERFDYAAKIVSSRSTFKNRPVVDKWINGLRLSCTGNSVWR